MRRRLPVIVASVVLFAGLTVAAGPSGGSDPNGPCNGPSSGWVTFTYDPQHAPPVPPLAVIEQQAQAYFARVEALCSN